jgi:hypothetical protein
MSLFDSTQNIEGIQLKYLLQPINDDMLFVFGDSSIWFLEAKKTTLNEEPIVDVLKSNFETSCLWYDDVKDVVERFNENYGNLQVNTNCTKSIPTQIADVLRGYLPSSSKLEIESDPLFISFNNNLSEYFSNVYKGYVLRHKIGQRGYDPSPDNIGYLHIKFHSDSCTVVDMTVHWFIPLVMVSSK